MTKHLPCSFDQLSNSVLGSCFVPQNMGGVNDLFFIRTSALGCDIICDENGAPESFKLLCPIPLAVGEYGTVVTLATPYRRLAEPKKIETPLNEDGYPVISGYQSYGLSTPRLHRIVWETFFGKIPHGLEVNHIDNNRANPRLDNLELLTHRENIIKSMREGRKPRCSYKDRLVLCVHRDTSIAPVLITGNKLAKLTKSSNCSHFWNHEHRPSLNGWYPIEVTKGITKDDLTTFLLVHDLASTLRFNLCWKLVQGVN